MGHLPPLPVLSPEPTSLVGSISLDPYGTSCLKGGPVLCLPGKVSLSVCHSDGGAPAHPLQAAPEGSPGLGSWLWLGSCVYVAFDGRNRLEVIITFRDPRPRHVTIVLTSKPN